MSRAWSRRLPDVVGSSSPEVTLIGAMSWTTAKDVVGRAVEFGFDEIRSADAVRGSRPRRLPGVRLQVPQANVIAVFWTSSYIAVLDRLSARGLPVTRAAREIGFKPLNT